MCDEDCVSRPEVSFSDLQKGSYMANILVIDDEDSTRTLFRIVLEQAGHTVREAVNGRQGLEQFKAQAADLVLTDITMPEMNGLDLILELTNNFLNVKVIAVSGVPESADQLQVARLLGARKTLQKSFDIEDLLRAVDYELTH